MDGWITKGLLSSIDTKIIVWAYCKLVYAVSTWTHKIPHVFALSSIVCLAVNSEAKVPRCINVNTRTSMNLSTDLNTLTKIRRYKQNTHTGLRISRCKAFLCWTNQSCCIRNQFTHLLFQHIQVFGKQNKTWLHGENWHSLYNSAANETTMFMWLLTLM